MTDKELRALLADMTLEEKLGEMTQLSPTSSVRRSRLT